VIQIAPQMRILVAVETIDFRNGIDGLARICKSVLQRDPFSGCLFECLFDCTRFGKEPSSGADHAPISSNV
jgi:hypothetical protein